MIDFHKMESDKWVLELEFNENTKEGKCYDEQRKE